jgi:DNA-binding PadR family transcriptional regulator
MAISKDLVAASATPLILSILAEGESYGYAIIRRVRDLSDGEMAWTDGMLYPVLHRLEQQRWVVTQWRKAESGRRRKYYRITPAGRDALREQQNEWLAVYNTLKKVWGIRQCSISTNRLVAGAVA